VDPIWFLAAAFALIACGSLVVALRHREPRREDAAIEAFQKEMRALSRESRRTTDPRLRPLSRDRSTDRE
jgi:hypothetical protein